MTSLGGGVTSLHVLAALFAVYMLVRHLPGASALARGQARSRPLAFVAAVNVLLALAILGFAVKGLVAGLISR
ncbi:MAG TPA: hypothetical protein VF912_10935 [Anaeromyxobacter sp.]